MSVVLMSLSVSEKTLHQQKSLMLSDVLSVQPLRCRSANPTVPARSGAQDAPSGAIYDLVCL